jgi:4-hydroxy-3-methylbut-2-enyl diphosphate reductase
LKEIIVAESAGFCFGVSRSVKLAEKAISESGPCFSLGELIHNDAVVADLESRGLTVASTVESIPDGARVVVRSHGITRAEFEALRAKNAEIIDATCPKVSNIHDIVSEACQKGRVPVIIGEQGHPEVIGICGWCEGAKVFADSRQLADWLDSVPDGRNLPITVVFQTTQTKTILEETKIFTKKECTNCEIFDTICSATSRRQNDAAGLSKKCGAMVVIGALHSANSRHLAEICSEHCRNVQFISGVGELNVAAFDGADTIGITAGASTPERIIKEVKQTMTDEIKTEETTAEQETKEEKVPAEEMSFDQMLEESIKTIYNGDTVTGIVAAITPTEISVDLGTKHSGYIPTDEFTDANDTPIDQLIKIGDTIEACVVRVNDVEGTVMLSKKRLDAVKSWAVIEEAADKGEILEGVVTEDNKGGVVVTVKGIRVFVPASQTGLAKDAEMNELLKQKVRLKITEVNRGRRRVVGSIRSVQRDERRERSDKIWNEIEVGKRYKGTVKSITGYGAFVDIGGIDGMVHVSELSWSRIKSPAEVLKVGEEIEVYVINFDKDNHKISLGYKDPNGNPWSRFMDTYKVGDVVNVKIVKLMPFGAFAEVLPGVDGLIHISQIANRRIGKPEEVLNIGDTVEAKITAIEIEKQKISLSIRALTEPEKAPEDENKAEEKPAPEGDALVYEVSADGKATGEAPAEESAAE